MAISEKKKLRFDLHIHTNKSDGKHDPEEIIKRAKKKRLDVVAITDHNVNAHGLDPKVVFEKYGVKLIQGFELSFLRGHVLVLGIEPEVSKEKLKEWKIKKRATKSRGGKKKIKRILGWCVDNGALVIAAHPCIPSGMLSFTPKFLKELYIAGLIHGAEIHNDDFDHKLPKKLYNLWHRRVFKTINKLGIPAYSNSDTHKIDRLGDTYNMVEIDDADNLIKLLKSKNFEIKHKKQQR